jgi:hypothetical protein
MRQMLKLERLKIILEIRFFFFFKSFYNFKLQNFGKPVVSKHDLFLNFFP